MKAVIITVAGISSRFNEGMPENEKVLKAIYTEDFCQNTLLFRLLDKCRFADIIVIVGGYKFNELNDYILYELKSFSPQIVLIENKHYCDLASGYSLYLGIKECLRHDVNEIVFVEGDLDFDSSSFATVVDSAKSVLTYTSEPIYANKSVVLYRDDKGDFKYVFNNDHGLLSIDEAFSSIFNSGQVWKFNDMPALKKANDEFYNKEKNGTNLRIIKRYIDAVENKNIELVCLKQWTNCNTRDEYNRIKYFWENKK